MIAERLASLGASTLSAAAPLAMAALGGLATEAAGSLSIALEGYMLAGAFAAAACGQAAGSLGLGMLAGAAAGLGISALVAAAALWLRADAFVAGLAANILAPGLVSVVSQAAYGTKGVLAAESLRTGPWAIISVLSLASLALALILSRSVFGLRLRAAGEGDEIALAAGISSARYRFAAHLIAGAAAGLAGAALAAGIGAYVPGMTNGRGWIALVAVFLGARRAGGVAAASLFFGFLFALSNFAQAFPGGGAADASELLQALPYIATSLALVIWRSLERGRKGGRRWPDSRSG
jgi:general nucleoside transport system permease protein